MKLLLTKSQESVVKLKALGLSEKMIAEKRYNSIHTIRTHVKRALANNSISNGFELVARYAANNPDIFKNAIVVLFISIQGLIMLTGDNVEKRFRVKEKTKTSKSYRRNRVY